MQRLMSVLRVCFAIYIAYHMSKKVKLLTVKILFSKLFEKSIAYKINDLVLQARYVLKS